MFLFVPAFSSLMQHIAFLDKHSHDSQSCRIQVSFQGLEWYMYNRTAAYDNIASALDPRASASRPESRHQSENATEPRRVNTKSSGLASMYLFLSQICVKFTLVSRSVLHSTFNVYPRGTSVDSISIYVAQATTTQS